MDKLVTREQWVSALREYLGVRFTHQGRTRTGVDCVGLLACAANDLGIPNAVYSKIITYARSPDSDMFKVEIAKLLVPLPYNRLQAYSAQFKPGDIFAYWIDTDGRPRHVAVYTGVDSQGYDTMIHAYAPKPHCVVEQRIEHDYWNPRLHSVWMLPNLED